MARTYYTTISGNVYYREYKPGPKPIPEELRRMSVSIRLPRWMLDQIDESGMSRTEFIEDAVREKLDRLCITQSV